MAQYLLNFHHFPVPQGNGTAPENLKPASQQWQNYIGGIAGQGKYRHTTFGAGRSISPAGTITDVVSDDKGLIVGTLTLETSPRKKSS
jgi:hypothetical protein